MGPLFGSGPRINCHQPVRNNEGPGNRPRGHPDSQVRLELLVGLEIHEAELRDGHRHEEVVPDLRFD